MDMEYYIRDLTLGKVDISEEKPARPVLDEGRRIDGKFAEDVVSLMVSCIAQVAKTTREDVEKQVQLEKQLYLSYFKSFVKFRQLDLSDEHYFDFTTYATFKAAEKLIPTSEDRVQLRALVGSDMFALMRREAAVDEQSVLAIKRSQGDAAALPHAARDIRRLLSTFQHHGFVESFTLEDEDLLDMEYITKTFSEDLSVQAQLTLSKPVTVLAFLEFAAADTFFHPEIIASCLQAYMRELGYECRFEDYLMDNEYRESNFNVQAQDVIVEMIVRRKR